MIPGGYKKLTIKEIRKVLARPAKDVVGNRIVAWLQGS